MKSPMLKDFNAELKEEQRRVDDNIDAACDRVTMKEYFKDLEGKYTGKMPPCDELTAEEMSSVLRTMNREGWYVSSDCKEFCRVSYPEVTNQL